jgi:hypothetical protein
MGREKEINNAPILSVSSSSIFNILQTVLLGVLALSLEAITSVRPSVRLFASISTASKGWFFVKCNGNFYENVDKIQISFKSVKNTVYFI